MKSGHALGDQPVHLGQRVVVDVAHDHVEAVVGDGVALGLGVPGIQALAQRRRRATGPRSRRSWSSRRTPPRACRSRTCPWRTSRRTAAPCGCGRRSPPGMTYLPAASMVSSAVSPAAARSAPICGDRLAVDQDVGGVRAVGGDDRAVGDERAHRSLLGDAVDQSVRRVMVGDGALPAHEPGEWTATASAEAALPLSERQRACGATRRRSARRRRWRWQGDDALRPGRRLRSRGRPAPSVPARVAARVESCDHRVPPRGAASRSSTALRRRSRRSSLHLRARLRTVTSLTIGARTSPVGPESAANGRDDVAAVGLELGLLVAVHQVEVELVDAGVGELAQLGDVLVGASRGRRTGRSPRRRRTPRSTSRPRRGGGSRSPSRSRM